MHASASAKLHELVEAVREEMHQRFDSVDQRLAFVLDHVSTSGGVPCPKSMLSKSLKWGLLAQFSQ
jgi:hypothetical protein